jgi:WD40 repeat protein
MKHLLWLAFVGLTVSPLSAQEPKLRSTLEGHTQCVNSIAFSPDGGVLASGACDSTIKLWDVSSGKNIATLNEDIVHVDSMAFSPDGKTLASGGFGNRIKLWDVSTGKNTFTLKRDGDGCVSLAFSPDGKILALGNFGRMKIKLWNVVTGRNTILKWHSEGAFSDIGIECLAFSPDGKTLASWSWDTIKLWNVATGKNIATWDVALIKHAPIKHTKYVPLVLSMAFSPDGKTLALGHSWDRTITLWNVASGKNTATLNGHADVVFCVAYSPDGKTLASGCSERESRGKHIIKLWDVGSGRHTATLKGHTHNVVSLAYSPDGKTLASGSWDKTIKLWDVKPGKKADKRVNDGMSPRRKMDQTCLLGKLPPQGGTTNGGSRGPAAFERERL